MRNIDACLYVRPSDRTTLAAIETWLTERNAKPKPFKWTAKANIILTKRMHVPGARWKKTSRRVLNE